MQLVVLQGVVTEACDVVLSGSQYHGPLHVYRLLYADCHSSSTYRSMQAAAVSH